MTGLAELAGELDRKGELTLAVKVVPGAARNEIAGRMADGALRLRIAAPAREGKANAELCAFLARLFGVPASSVKILAGAGSTRKRVRIVR